MKEKKYRFWSGDKSYTGFGYTETRCNAILDLLACGWGTDITKVEMWNDRAEKWVETDNTKI